VTDQNRNAVIPAACGHVSERTKMGVRMKIKKLLIAICLFAFCSNPISNNDKESIITCLNGYSCFIRYNNYPQGKCPEYFTNEIAKNTWATLEFQFNLHDSLKFISFSPGRNDTLCLDTIWAEDTNHIMKIYTFGSFTTWDTTAQLGIGFTGVPGGPGGAWKKLDTKTLAFCPGPSFSDSTYSAEILFMHPIISDGHIKIRIKATPIP
jgi:hypothetical protein